MTSGRRVPRATQATRDRRASKERRVPRALLVPRVPRATRETRARPEPRDRRVTPATRGRGVRLAPPVLTASPARTHGTARCCPSRARRVRARPTFADRRASRASRALPGRRGLPARCRTSPPTPSSSTWTTLSRRSPTSKRKSFRPWQLEPYRLAYSPT